MTSPEDLGRIHLDGGRIVYESTTYPSWELSTAELRILGEFTNQNGPFAEDGFLCFVTGPDLWYEASMSAGGCLEFLSALAEKLGAPLEPTLLLSTDFASNILWPADLAGKPLFQFQKQPPPTTRWRCFKKLLGPWTVWQTYAPEVMDLLRAGR